MLPSGVTTTNAYDGAGRMLETTSVAGMTTLQSFDYAYDAVGNRTSQVDRNSQTTTYAYDALNRLVEFDPPAAAAVDYAYDAAGNRTEAGSVIYTYDALNQLTSDSTGTDYDYDGAGRLVDATNGSDTTTYAYDALDQLVEVDDGSAPIAYSYDALGRRSERTQSSATETAHYGDLADRAILDTDSGGIFQSFVAGPAGLVEQEVGSGVEFPLCLVSDAGEDVVVWGINAGDDALDVVPGCSPSEMTSCLWSDELQSGFQDFVNYVPTLAIACVGGGTLALEALPALAAIPDVNAVVAAGGCLAGIATADEVGPFPPVYR